MSTRKLALLVLGLVLGVALSVGWYLAAEGSVQAAPAPGFQVAPEPEPEAQPLADPPALRLTAPAPFDDSLRFPAPRLREDTGDGRTCSRRRSCEGKRAGRRNLLEVFGLLGSGSEPSAPSG